MLSLLKTEIIIFKYVIITYIKEHGEKDNQPKPNVEIGNEVDHSYQDVGNGWQDAEDNAIQQPVNAVCASVHHPEHLSSLPGQMPPQTEAVQMLEQINLHSPCRVLLHPDPQKGAHVVEKPHSSRASALEEFKSNIDQD